MSPQSLMIGRGCGGLEAAKVFRGAALDVTLIDKSNHHLFQPLLYQVATAGLTAPSIAEPIRRIFRTQANVAVLMGEVTDIVPSARTVVLAGGQVVPYDHLIVAAGATHGYFGRDDCAPHAPGLKTLDDAFLIGFRNRLFVLFDWAWAYWTYERHARIVTGHDEA